MSFDGFVTRCVAEELKEKILGGKIDKIYQPEKDEIIIAVRTREGTHRLLLSANASNPRIHLTTVPRENPMAPPMLCMLLRKHLSGGIISGVEQNSFDRVIRIITQAKDELGDICIRSVICEIMGRHSNIIITDQNNKILDSAKHIDFTVSAVRQVLPGLIYFPPPSQDKTPADKLTAPLLMNKLAALPDDTMLDKFLLNEILGMSPLLAREIVFRFCGNARILKGEADIAAFTVHAMDFLNSLCQNMFSPSLVSDKIEKKPSAFSCVELTQYENSAVCERSSSISEVIDAYFEKRSSRENMNRRSAALLKLVHNNMERCEKKLALHRENLESSKNRETYRIYGELITANLYRIKLGMKYVEVENYYSEDGGIIKIPLREDISPSQNAQSYFKKYSKAKTTEQYASEQIKLAEDELFYLETVAEALCNFESIAELDEIRQELTDGGYLPKQRGKKQKSQKRSEPFKFISVDGYEILIGRNNKQNDELTLKSAFATDIWFHTKNIPGSHTIVRTRGTGKAPDTTLMQAAKLAAFYSKAKNSSQVPVDYTAVKNVKKPNGAKPGMVIYDHYNTVYVTPAGPDES